MKDIASEEIARIRREFATIVKAQSKNMTGEILENLRTNTPVDTGAARDAWEIQEDGSQLSITNSKPYITRLNEGSSQQAPAHFIERSILQVRGVEPSGLSVIQNTDP